MIIQNWEKLPEKMQNSDVEVYYNILKKRGISLFFKRIFDLIFSLICIVLFSPIFLVLSIWIKLDSKGPIFFRQVRVTTNMREFKIFKFRTMVVDAEKIGSQVTKNIDARITRCGFKIRRYRLDEIPQLFNIFLGDMTFVGTRPEVSKYVASYSDEMLSTFLLPAGVTSRASIQFKDEDKLLADVLDVDTAYVEKVLPEKMKYNLEELKRYSFFRDIKIMLKTIVEVF